MCGLVWVAHEAAAEIAPAALRRLQYRGYDSFGFAWPDASGITGSRSLEDLREFHEELPSSSMVLAHTRWATHGRVSLENCHPHRDGSGRFALAHNGIISNHREFLLQAESHAQDSDTAILSQYFSALLDQGHNPEGAFEAVVSKMQGRNALLVMMASGEVFAYRNGSPLVLVQLQDGIGLASDVHALGAETVACCTLADHARVVCRGRQVHVNGALPRWQALPVTQYAADVAVGTARRAGHFMRQEILEQWQSVTSSLPQRDQLEKLRALLQGQQRILVTGAGGAGIVAQQIAHFLKVRAGFSALGISACEFAYQQAHSSGACLLAISQSGETADTLVAIEQARSWGMPVVTLVNMPLSTMAEVADLNFSLGAGPEQCVLSTKSATAQISFGYWCAALLAGTDIAARAELQDLGVTLSQILEPGLFSHFDKAVDYLANRDTLFLLGQGAHFASAQLGALNLKEASYIHAEAFSAGELKHGVLALVEAGTPVILFGLDVDPYMQGVAAELKSRGAMILAVGSTAGDIYLPDPGNGHPVSEPISCQILAYLLARRRGLDPDRPRNLAKSVTVL